MKPRFLTLLVTVAALSAVGCPPHYPEQDPTVQGACRALASNHCKEARVNETECASWLGYYSDKPAGPDPVCLSRITTCDDVDKCGRLQTCPAKVVTP